MSPKRVLKGGAFAVATVIAAPAILLSIVERAVSQSEQLFRLCGQIAALIPGMPGAYIRAAYYAFTLERCSWEVHIGFGSLVMHRGAVLAERVSTGAYCIIGHAAIGAGARLASHVSIPSGKRQHLDADGQLSSVTVYERVTVGEGCWLGEGAIVLADVGSHTIVSAGAVVTDAAPGRSIVGGNPARVLKSLHGASAGMDGD